MIVTNTFAQINTYFYVSYADFSVTTSAGKNRALLVYGVGRFNDDNAVSSVTYNNIALSPVASYTGNRMYLLLNPPIGTFTLRVNTIYNIESWAGVGVLSLAEINPNNTIGTVGSDPSNTLVQGYAVSGSGVRAYDFNANVANYTAFSGLQFFAGFGPWGFDAAGNGAAPYVRNYGLPTTEVSFITPPSNQYGVAMATWGSPPTLPTGTWYGLGGYAGAGLDIRYLMLNVAPASPPTVGLGILDTNTLRANISPADDLGNPQGQFRFNYGSSSGVYTNNTPLAPYTGSAPQTVTQANTLPLGLSYVRAELQQDAWGTVYSSEGTVETSSAPTATTINPTKSGTDADLRGTVTNNWNNVEWSFQWGVVSGVYIYETTPVSATKNLTTDNKTSTISGLTINNTYYYRIKVTSSYGTYYGTEVSWVQNSAPSVILDEATKSNVELFFTGTVNPNGLDTDYHFEWGITSGVYTDSTTPVNVGSGSNDEPASGTASGLNEDTIYYYRLVAENSGGITYSAERSIRTYGQPLAYVYAGETRENDVIVRGSYNLKAPAGTYYFEYGTDIYYGQQSQPVAVTDMSSAVETLVENMLNNTEYHYRLVVNTAYGTAYSTDMTIMSQHIRWSHLVKSADWNYLVAQQGDYIADANGNNLVFDEAEQVWEHLEKN